MKENRNRQYGAIGNSISSAFVTIVTAVFANLGLHSSFTLQNTIFQGIELFKITQNISKLIDNYLYFTL